jgi:hypothetical protein
MEMNIVPECFFDTILVMNILKVKKINHQKSCSKVANTIKGMDDFALGIIDKDKKEEEIKYLNEFNPEIITPNLILLKHRTKQHYFIQLIPAIEKWVLNVIKEGNIHTEDLNLPLELVGLKDYTKYKFADENEELKKLCKKLINGGSKTMTTLTLWLTYLYQHNRNADINVLKENV